MSKKTFFIVCSIMCLIPLMVFAGDSHDHTQKKIDKINGQVTTIEGLLVCKNCSLKKDFGARSECKLNGCQNALKTADGRFIDFLDNKFAKDLKGEKYFGKQIKLTGTLFPQANTIDVQTISLDGKVISWCDNCSAMDGCTAKK